MNTYVWTITELNCLPTAGSLTDYVVTAIWLCTGTDGTYTGKQNGSTLFAVNPNDPNYVPYNQLTEAEVIQWVQETLTPTGVAAVTQAIDLQIQSQANPPIISPPLPWNSPPSK